MTDSKPESRWLALLHQLPAKPPYLRVKVWRRLQAMGAVPLKHAVHVLPRRPECAVALQDLRAEIVASGGEAILIEARLIAGLSDEALRSLFDAARDADYEEVALAARTLLDTGPATGLEIERLRKRLAEIETLDFFGAHGRQAAQAALREVDMQRHIHPDVSRPDAAATPDPAMLRNRIWVTRRGVHVDRIACAWLIRRFIDPKARFKFVDGKRYAATQGELRFDMADGEFTHEGAWCSFETLLHRAGLDSDSALVAIGEMIHDLDIGDSRFDRPETTGLGAMLSGICASSDDDLDRIAKASDALGQFHAFFTSRRPQ